MLNDLAVFTEAWRKKQPYGDTEGDPRRHWPADPKAYYLYFMDDGTYGLCADCRTTIPFERLVAMPAARFCVRCQQRRDRDR